MVNYGNIIRCEFQLCLVHAIHLAIRKVLYSTKTDEQQQNLINQNCEDSSEDDDDENEEDFETNFPEDSSLVLNESIHDTLKKVRDIVSFFKKSPVRNGLLQKYVKEITGSTRELKLKKDCPTRWNSILAMAKRFVEIEPAIKKALGELSDNDYDNYIFNVLKEIITCLTPLEEAILEIGKSDANLLKADSAVQYVLSTLAKSQQQLSQELYSSLKNELQKRRKTTLVSLYKCLHTKSFDFITKSNSELGYSSKSEIICAARSLYFQLFEQSTQPPEHDELGDCFLSPDETEVEEDQSQPSSLFDFVQKEMSVSSQQSNQTDIKAEFKSMITTQVLPPKLQLLYNALSTVQPSSTSCEEAFSVASLFATKQRNSTGPNLLNVLVFLKYYFLKKDGKQLKNRI